MFLKRLHRLTGSLKVLGKPEEENIMLKGILFCFLAAISTVSYAQDVEDLIIKLDSTVSYLIDTLNISPEQKLD